MTAIPSAADFASAPDVAGDPYSGAELAAELRRIHAESERYWAAYDTPAYFRRPQPEVWAPADQVRHLTKSIAAVARGLALPRPLLLLLFGWARRPSRRLEALRAEYRAALVRGAQAGRFAPRALDGADESQGSRSRIMARHADSVAALVAAFEHWSERSLDRYRLPHPVLGKLTVREMLLFTVLHNVHHVHVAERRRRGQAK